MPQTPTLVFLYESEHDVMFSKDAPPYAAYSHFSHMFLIAHEAIRMGWKVYFYCIAYEDAYPVQQVYPIAVLGETIKFTDSNFKPDMMFCINFPHTLGAVRRQKPDAIGVYILNAHFWLEQEYFRSDFVEWLRVAVANDMDFILTQNHRMADICHYLFNLTARWQWRDRVLCAPNTFTHEMVDRENARYDRAAVREEMLVRDDEIVIINSGGPWSWTDTDVFATAFAQVIREGAKRLKFIQMGVIQDSNEFQKHIVPFWRDYLIQNNDLTQMGRIFVFTNWQEASAHMPAWNYGADIGLNVSKDTVENYQSHRVRLIDYTKAGLPVINTTGNYYATYDARDAVMTVDPGDLQGYKDLLWKLERGEIDLNAKRAAMAKFKASISSENLIPQILEEMRARGRVPAADRAHLREHIHQLYQSITQSDFANNFKAS